MKCDELEFFFGGAASWAEVYKKSDVDEAIDELKARIHELQSTTHTDNSAVIGLLSDELEKLRPMEAALEIAEADNKKYIERIKELEDENEKLKATPEQIMKETFDKVLIYPKELVSIDDAYKLAVETKKAKHALWLARAAREKTEYQHWILIWRCANTNQYFFINKTRYKHTSKVDRMRYPWEWRDMWLEVEKRCIKKAEEYK